LPHHYIACVKNNQHFFSTEQIRNIKD